LNAAVNRRTFIARAVPLGALVVSGKTYVGRNFSSARDRRMYGLIGKMTVIDGQRDAMIAILLGSIAKMPGCLSYVVAEDAADANAIWITEVWEDEESHAASLSLPAVRAAINKAKPLIAGFGDHVVTRPVGGHGIANAK
jgi:quinol monooxygenase YgiN